MRIFKLVILGALLTGAIALMTTLGHAPAASAAHGTPSAGWTIHVDAQKHFANHPDAVAHHWCRAVGGSEGMLECQLYASDDDNAPMVGTELIVPTATWRTFDPAEKALWHYHKTEIPKVNASMPDVSAADAAKMVANLNETYGKIYLLWDPMDSKVPVGKPMVYVLP